MGCATTLALGSAGGRFMVKFHRHYQHQFQNAIHFRSSYFAASGSGRDTTVVSCFSHLLSLPVLAFSEVSVGISLVSGDEMS